MDLVVNLSNKEEKRKFIALIEEMKGRHVFYSEPAGEVRTMEMNRYYRVLLVYISIETGHSDAFIHDFCKTMLIPQVKWGMDPDITTTNMTKKEMLRYFEWIKFTFTKQFPQMKWPPQDKIVRPKKDRKVT